MFYFLHLGAFSADSCLVFDESYHILLDRVAERALTITTL